MGKITQDIAIFLTQSARYGINMNQRDTPLYHNLKSIEGRHKFPFLFKMAFSISNAGTVKLLPGRPHLVTGGYKYCRDRKIFDREYNKSKKNWYFEIVSKLEVLGGFYRLMQSSLWIYESSSFPRHI